MVHIRQSRPYGTCKTVKARFWPWLQVKILQKIELSFLRSGAGAADGHEDFNLPRGPPPSEFTEGVSEAGSFLRSCFHIVFALGEGAIIPVLSECGMYKVERARLWPWLQVKS